MLFTQPDIFKSVTMMYRVYMHEAERVYSDKLIDEKDIQTFHTILKDICKKNFDDAPEEELFAQPLKICHFAKGVGEPKYDQIASWEGINQILVDTLDSYNDVNAAMNLVLFEDAMSHILRINRILEMPRGNALLVGVGGSGKQSLSRLSAFISGLDVFQVGQFV
jgi:dynein heavy chain